MKSVQTISQLLLFLPLLAAGAAFRDRLPIHETLPFETPIHIQSQPTSAPQATVTPQDNSLKRIFTSLTSAINLFLSRTANITLHQHHEHENNKSFDLQPRSPEEYEPKEWANAPYDPTDINTQYPWRSSHDVQRPNHQSWRNSGPQSAYCIHVKPNSRPPLEPLLGVPSDRNFYYPRNVTAFLHSGWGGQNAWSGQAKLIDGGDPDMLGKWELPVGDKQEYLNAKRPKGGHQSLTAYIVHSRAWDRTEHCRAGCETCFDAMAEFGAEQAVCRRRVHGFHEKPWCGVGVVLGHVPASCYRKWLTELKEWTAGKEEAWVSPWRLKGVWEWWDAHHQCYLEYDSPIYQELGYFSMEEAMDSARVGNIRAYYVEDLPHVGAEVEGELGKAALLKILLGKGRNDKVTEGDIRQTIDGMSQFERDRYIGP